MTDRRMVWISHAPRVSGAEKVMLGLIDEALADGWSVTIISPPGPLVASLPDVVTHVPIPDLALSGETGPARVRALAALAVNTIRAGVAIRKYGRGARVIVNSLYALPAARLGVWPDTFTWLVHDTLSYGKQRVAVHAGRGSLRRAVAVSEQTAKPLTDMGITTAVCYNGVDPDQSTDHPDDPSGPPVVGVLAAITEWKGQRVAIAALCHLPDVRLELAGGCFDGDEPYLESLRALVAEFGLTDRVRFLGHTEPIACLRRWDISLSTSIAPEAGPIGVLEAMSVGTPVIGSDHGGAAEYLADGRGVLVPPADPVALAAAIRRVLDDDDLRADLIDRSRHRVRDRHDIAEVRPAMLAALVSD
ncbi:glycosyltransferase family 4 protein [Gordonia sp. VNK1]|uniref:glycosyltransferase family 4 protein n=1 Tax=Gordonia oleivorans TaxID=3156618 RepID=UPI0032B31D5D